MGLLQYNIIGWGTVDWSGLVLIVENFTPVNQSGYGVRRSAKKILLACLLGVIMMANI
jgi:hypothetical protein